MDLIAIFGNREDELKKVWSDLNVDIHKFKRVNKIINAFDNRGIFEKIFNDSELLFN